VQRRVLVAEARVEGTRRAVGVGRDVGNRDLVERAVLEELLDRSQEEVEGEAAPPLTRRAVPLIVVRLGLGLGCC
jgi:hypothetical protein